MSKARVAALSIVVAAMYVLAGFGMLKLGQLISADKSGREAVIQKNIAELHCVHTGYRGRDSSWVYTCDGGRLMERGREGMEFSD